MVLYYLLLFVIPFHADPRLGVVLFNAGPLIVTPIKLLGFLTVAAACLASQPEASAPRLRNVLPLLFIPFAVLPIIVSFASNLPESEGQTGQIGQLISAVLLFAATRPLVRTRDRMVKSTRLLVVAFAFSSLWVYKQHFGEHESRAWGVENESNYEALMLLLSIPMAFWMGRYEPNSGWRRIGLSCGLLLIGAVLLTESRAGIIAGGVMGLVAAITTKRKLMGIALLAALLLIVFSFGPAGMSQRFRNIKLTGSPQNGDEGSSRVHVELLKAGLRMMESHPVFGIGMGQFKAVAPEYNPVILEVSDRSYIAHNTMVQIGAECGVPVLLLFIGMLGVALHNFWLGRFSSDPMLATLSLSMLIALIGIIVGTLTQTSDLLPFSILMILSQNLREIAVYQPQREKYSRSVDFTESAQPCALMSEVNI